MARFNVRVVGHADGQRVDALLDSDSSFLMWDMGRDHPQNGVITGVLLMGAALRGATSIPVDGLPVSQTHLKAGDYIGISGKLYRLTADVAASGGGVGTLTLNRGLLADVADNTAVNTDRPTCEMFLADDDQPSRTVDFNRVYDYSLSFIELL